MYQSPESRPHLDQGFGFCILGFRFGDPKQEKGEGKQWALMFQTHCSCKFLETYLRQLSVIRQGGYMPDRIVNLNLQYITSR